MNLESIFDLIVINLRELINDQFQEPITRDSKLCLLGVGSVGRAELIEKTLEDLKLDVDRSEFHIASNLGELADLLYQKNNLKPI